MINLEIVMPGKCHYIVLTQSLPEPIGDSSLAYIMECSLVHAGFYQYLVELLREVVNHFVAGAGESPFTTGLQFLLDVVISARWNKDIKDSPLVFDSEVKSATDKHLPSRVETCYRHP